MTGPRVLPGVLLAGLLVAGPAHGLAVHAPDPGAHDVPGLATASFEVRLRAQGSADRTLAVTLDGPDPARASLAPGDGTPGPADELDPTAHLQLAPPGDACWRGWCDVHTLHVEAQAPNRNGTHELPLRVQLGDEAVEVPLRVHATARHVHAERVGDHVRVHPGPGPDVQGAQLVHDDHAWAAAPDPDGTFATPVDALPRDVPLVPRVRYADDVVLEGPPLVLPPVSPGPTEGDGGPEDGTDPVPEPPRPPPASEPPGTPGDGTSEAPHASGTPAHRAVPHPHLATPVAGALLALALAGLRRRQDGLGGNV